MKKAKFFTSYKKVMNFIVELSYRGSDFVIRNRSDGWEVRYR